jgi:hypothetical protein
MKETREIIGEAAEGVRPEQANRWPSLDALDMQSDGAAFESCLGNRLLYSRSFVVAQSLKAICSTVP